MVIALEDIGIGDPDVALQLIALSTRPRWREEFGGDLAVLDRLLAEGCAAIKDRSGDHVYSLISEGHPVAFPKAPPQASRSVLLTTVASPTLPALTRLDAAVRVADLSTGPKRPPRLTLAGLEALFGLYRDLRCPPLLIDACKAYTQKSSDLLPLVIPLVWILWKETRAEPGSISHDVGFADLGGGMPSYAFDPLHTRPGKRAVSMWLKSYPRLPWSVSQVSAALWNVDAAVCDHILAWNEGGKLRRSAYRADLLRAGVPPEQCDDLMAWVRREYHTLQIARHIVWSDMRRQSSSNSPSEHTNPPLSVSDKRAEHD